MNNNYNRESVTVSFFTKIQNSIRRFLQGKNGVDILSRDLSVFALILMVLDAVLQTNLLYFLGVLVFIVAIYRICSRNITKRATENRAYIAIREKFLGWFRGKKQYSASKKQYRYYKCSDCGQRVRIPRGRGKVEITCPKCGKHFIKKS